MFISIEETLWFQDRLETKIDTVIVPTRLIDKKKSHIPRPTETYPITCPTHERINIQTATALTSQFLNREPSHGFYWIFLPSLHDLSSSDLKIDRKFNPFATDYSHSTTDAGCVPSANKTLHWFLTLVETSASRLGSCRDCACALDGLNLKKPTSSYKSSKIKIAQHRRETELRQMKSYRLCGTTLGPPTHGG